MQILFETPRLLLRPFHAMDAEGFYRMNNDPAVLRYTGDQAFASLVAAEQFITQYNHYEQYGFGRWKKKKKTDQAYLGFCGLKYTRTAQEVDLGYRLLRAYWGKAYATEAAKACLAYGFDQLLLPKIVGRAQQANPASYRVLEKIGMQFEKSFLADKQLWLQYSINNPNPIPKTS
ncbi:MAG: GNAT family N-acetyltransferase [Saprospiraceae bacterium]